MKSQLSPPPPPAPVVAAVEEDTPSSTPAAVTPLAPASVDDGDSDSENEEDGTSPSVPVPVVAPAAARSHYLEDIMGGGAAASGDVLGMMMGSAKRPPAPPPPPPVAPSTPAKSDHTPVKTLLKPRPVSQNMSASNNRMSMRLNSTDSISSQLNAFALSFAGTALPEEMDVVPEHPQEDEIDVFAAVNSTKSTFAPPPPLPVREFGCFLSLSPPNL